MASFEQTLQSSEQEETASDSDPLAKQFQRQMGKISRQSSISFAGTLFTVATGYFFKIYVARLLGAEGLGLYALGMSVIAFVGIFASFGLPRAATRFISVYNSQGEVQKLRGFLWRGLILILLISTGLGGAVWLARGWITGGLYNEPNLTPYMPFFAVMVPLSAIGFFLGQVLHGFQAVDRQTIINSFVQRPLTIAMELGFLSLGWGLGGYIAGSMLGTIVNVVLMAWLVWRLMPAPTRALDKPLDRLDGEVLSFSASMIALSLLGFVSGKADHTMLGIFLNARQVGIYSVAKTTTSYVPTLLTAVNSIFAPVIADLYAREKLDLLKRLFQTLTKWILGLTLPLVMVIMLFAPTLMRIFGAEFEAGWPVLVAVSIGQLVNVGVGSVGYILMMSGRQRFIVGSQVVSSVVTFGLYLILIPILGPLGAALGFAIGVVVSNVLNLWHIRRELNLWPYHRSFLKLIFPVVMTGAGLLIFQAFLAMQLSPIIAVLIALGLAYSVFLPSMLITGLDDYDRLILDAVRRRLGVTMGAVE